MWDTILGFVVAILLTLAFFILGKVFFAQGYKGHGKHGHWQGEWLLVFAIAAIILSALLVLDFFGFWLVMKKLGGLLLLAFGFFMLVKFPAPPDYQPEGFFWLGVAIGLFCTFLGIYWLLF